MIVWVAYSANGDLIVEADNENDLYRKLALYDIDEDEVYIGRVTA